MDVGVLLHVGFLVESFTAELARVGPRVGVNQQVRGQGRRPLEALSALTTFETPLGAVDRAMLTEADGMAERLTARTALVRATTAAVRPSTVNLYTDKRIHQLSPN